MGPSFAQDRSGPLDPLRARQRRCALPQRLYDRLSRVLPKRPQSRPAPRADRFGVAILRMVRRDIQSEGHNGAFEWLRGRAR